MVICDSDTLIDYLDENAKRHSNAVDVIENKIGLDNAMISVVTKMEILAGASNKKEQTELAKHIDGFALSLINDKVSLKALELFLKYNLSHSLKIPDAIIAATAIEAEVELFTYNTKDFKFISGLKLLSTK